MNRASSSKIGNKCSPAPATVERRKKQSPRNPLKNLNGIASSSNSNSSSTSSVSIEAQRGCLRFFLSNSSRTTPLHRPKPIPKTPKSAPNARPSRSKLPKENLPKPTTSDNQNTSQKLQKPKKNPPCLYQWQSGRKLSSRAAQKPKPSPVCDNSGNSVNKLASGSQVVRVVDGTGEPPELRIFGNDGHFTPVSKLVSGSGLDCTFDKVIIEENTTTTTTPPVQASVSPEIQCGSSVVSTTSACYGAGHLVSGVTDKRKCRPKGVLTIGENGSDDDGNVIGVVNKARVSVVPLPTEASMHWLLSPCGEEDEDHQKGNSGNGSRQYRRLVASNSHHSPSSPSSDHGFSSDVCNNSNNTSTTTKTSRRSRASLLSPNGLPEFQGVLGPSFDDMAGCLSSASPHATPSCKAVVSQEEIKYRYNLAVENSPFSMDSLGSGNVIRTPQSDSSSDRHVGLSWLNAVDHQKRQFEFELDSVAEVLKTTSISPKSQISLWDPTGLSFQFDRPATSSNSIDLNQLQKILDNRSSWISNSTSENVSQSQMRISWREGLVSRIFEMDELDCCRCLSDEEEDASCCSNDRFKSQLGHELNVEGGNDQILTSGLRSPEFVDHEPGIDGKGKEKFPPQRPNSCAESISTDGGGLVASGDSDWTLCYKNQLFEVVIENHHLRTTVVYNNFRSLMFNCCSRKRKCVNLNADDFFRPRSSSGKKKKAKRARTEAKASGCLRRPQECQWGLPRGRSWWPWGVGPNESLALPGTSCPSSRPGA